MAFLSISENILFFLSGFGVLQGILLAVVIYLYSKSDKSVTRWLALFVGAVSIPILMPVGQQLHSWQVIIFVEPFTLLIGPLLYFYVRSFKEEITWRKAWPHLVLFVLYIINAYFLFTEVGLKYPFTSTVPPEVPGHPLSFYPVIGRLIQRLVYYWLAMRVLIRYQKSIRQLFSDVSRINLGWVRWLVNGYLVFVIVTIVAYSLILKYPERFSLWVLMIGSVVSIYIYLAAWKGISQSTLWQLKPEIKKEVIEKEMQEAEKMVTKKAEVKPIKVVSIDKRFEDIAPKIISLMEKEKLYQETELTLLDLANKLQLPSYQVSLAINEGLNKSFYDMINGYRVEEAKRLLADPKNLNYTILSVGFEAGFNSKTTFNTVFKKFTGLTPTDFRNRLTVPEAVSA
jgi:AraC-like DNA-binding protein